MKIGKAAYSLELFEQQLYLKGFRLLGVQYNAELQRVEAIVEHEDLPDVPPGAEPTPVNITAIGVDEGYVQVDYSW